MKRLCDNCHKWKGEPKKIKWKPRKGGGLMKTLRRNRWVGALAMGMFFMVIGGSFVYMGNDAKNMITDELVT